MIIFADWPCSEVHLVSVSQRAEPSKHEVSLLLDNKFVTVLTVAKNTVPDILCFFDIKNIATTNENSQLGLVTEVRRCHTFFFTLLSNGVVCILCMEENKTAFVMVVCFDRSNVCTNQARTHHLQLTGTVKDVSYNSIVEP